MPVLRRYKEQFLQQSIIYETSCLHMSFNITMVSLWMLIPRMAFTCVHQIVYLAPYCSVESHMGNIYVESLTVKLVLMFIEMIYM